MKVLMHQILLLRNNKSTEGITNVVCYVGYWRLRTGNYECCPICDLHQECERPATVLPLLQKAATSCVPTFTRGQAASGW